jgi:hypothetical protein
MSTPDTTDELNAAADMAARIRALNDAWRTEPWSMGSALADNSLVVTRGVADHGNDFIDRAITAVRAFSDFNQGNDPYGEHDFGNFEIDGHELCFKIDYYDRSLEWGSPDPADPAVTRRVLTILLAEEY